MSPLAPSVSDAAWSSSGSPSAHAPQSAIPRRAVRQMVTGGAGGAGRGGLPLTDSVFDGNCGTARDVFISVLTPRFLNPFAPTSLQCLIYLRCPGLSFYTFSCFLSEAAVSLFLFQVAGFVVMLVII